MLVSHWQRGGSIFPSVSEHRDQTILYALVCEKRFSVTFTSADKSYLTYPYPTRGIAEFAKVVETLQDIRSGDLPVFTRPTTTLPDQIDCDT